MWRNLTFKLDKKEWDYWNAILLAFRTSECKMKSNFIYYDFEKALINAIRDQFIKVEIIGCLFY